MNLLLHGALKYVHLHFIMCGSVIAGSAKQTELCSHFIATILSAWMRRNVPCREVAQLIETQRHVDESNTMETGLNPKWSSAHLSLKVSMLGLTRQMQTLVKELSNTCNICRTDSFFHRVCDCFVELHSRSVSVSNDCKFFCLTS